MPDLSSYAAQLRGLADALEAQSEPGDDPFIPHPDTLEVINNRHTKRGQLNYAVPDQLQLQRRIRRYNADTDTAHGDIVALALDTWLRAKGYPPDLTPLKTEAP
ncbi:hypothetical protein [Streptomyces olivochromogenes]|uniref:Uncharacterized protein n=1 Tax=Streptomyces olivochromogenes TaxID=1963 RepID=A0A250VWL1_STROL|nr:hypothetical protein [Streptomyces olivochromogenes]KUN33787.1 hypothetical protein AQJ27_49905 [Streptomyces olivochromogenes]GAX58350.1 hypothetical protein SO3561_09923 [Streptomyces olivochromogenes]